ncbi:4-hydroxy-tetrahydrodipicolinate synthase [Porphyridium purpureum]|uniref:4-hydroxy-tetrahydrodipicolinate synthase n=1 Tax=Porphyridium purpureum TaxID=35688 RepID=A0A5J4Z9C3_PORPP|nr:4-hydroxy-tetrahydrodipicolinate synthase [Porphyridium purpureum]|eukprot:POR4017..scf295_1
MAAYAFVCGVGCLSAPRSSSNAESSLRWREQRRAMRRAVAPARSRRVVEVMQAEVSSSSAPHFGKLITAMVTPFKVDGSAVDYVAAEQLAAYLAKNGSDSLVVGGTTGESPTLTWSEQYELFNVCKNAVASTGCKIIAGAGSNSTLEAIEATKRAAKLGLDGTLQVVPYYNKPPQEGLYQHFGAVAKCEPDLPVMLYNIPGRCGINMSAETTVRLARDFENIIATKEAAGDFEQFAEVRRFTPRDTFHMYAGDDSLTLPLLALGGTGVVSVASHFIGNELAMMMQHYTSGKVDEAMKIHFKYSHLFRDLFCMPNPIPAKACLRMQGWSVGPCRLPLTAPTPQVEEKLSALMKSLELL